MILSQNQINFGRTEFREKFYLTPKLKEMRDQVDFLHIENHQNFLQVDIDVFGVGSQVFPKYPKETSLQYLNSISRKS